MSKMESKMFKLKNGLSIHADLMGDGPLMLCFSGFGNSNHNFKLLAPLFAHKYTMCMIDARGMGKSDAAPTEYKMEDLAQDAYEIAGLLGHKNFGVIGISLGGYPAQLMAMEHPEAVKAVAMIATRGPGKDFEIIKAVTEEGFTAFMKMDPEQGDRIAIAAFVHPNFIKNHPAKLEEIIALRKRENKITLEQCLKQLRAGFAYIDSESYDLGKIKAPTLILAGQNDCFLPEQNARLLHQRIPGSELQFVPETSHLCFFEKPEWIAESILKFMENKI